MLVSLPDVSCPESGQLKRRSFGEPADKAFRGQEYLRLARNLRLPSENCVLPAHADGWSGRAQLGGWLCLGLCHAQCGSRRRKLTEITMAQAKQNQVKDIRKRILLVDDHAVVRYGIAQLINQQSDLVVCGEEEDAAKALSAIGKLKPDLVIADISLKDSSGLELMRNIKAQYSGLPVLVVSTHDEIDLRGDCFSRGRARLFDEGGCPGRSRDGDSPGPQRKRLCERRARRENAPAAGPRANRTSSSRRSRGSAIGSWRFSNSSGNGRRPRKSRSELHLSIKTIEYYREQIKQKLNLKGAVELTQYATSWVQRECPI